jgi:hypothetical protein
MPAIQGGRLARYIKSERIKNIGCRFGFKSLLDLGRTSFHALALLLIICNMSA